MDVRFCLGGRATSLFFVILFACLHKQIRCDRRRLQRALRAHLPRPLLPGRQIWPPMRGSRGPKLPQIYGHEIQFQFRCQCQCQCQCQYQCQCGSDSSSLCDPGQHDKAHGNPAFAPAIRRSAHLFPRIWACLPRSAVKDRVYPIQLDLAHDAVAWRCGAGLLGGMCVRVFVVVSCTLLVFTACAQLGWCVW